MEERGSGGEGKTDGGGPPANRDTLLECADQIVAFRCPRHLPRWPVADGACPLRAMERYSRIVVVPGKSTTVLRVTWQAGDALVPSENRQCRERQQERVDLGGGEERV